MLQTRSDIMELLKLTYSSSDVTEQNIPFPRVTFRQTKRNIIKVNDFLFKFC